MTTTTPGIELGKPIVVEATKAAMARLPEGSRSAVAEASLVVAPGEAPAVVAAITEHMRAIVKADRSANMYREGKLRQVRTAVIAAHPDGKKGLPQPKAKGATAAAKKARVDVLNDKLRADRATKAAAKRPATVTSFPKGSTVKGGPRRARSTRKSA